ncbi:MAG: DinB family protein [Acidobacteria bacterium]|nr:DinB family protein [Acidobacteriota bacterium]
MAHAAVRSMSAALDSLAAALDGAHGPVTASAPRVSAWTIAQQIDHALKANQAFFERIAGAKEPLPGGIRLMGRVVLSTGFIPRGVGKSPKAVLGEPLTDAQLREAYAACRKAFDEACTREDLFVNRWPVAKHPYFGPLNAEQSMKFCAIHTRHHLALIRDIGRSAVS